MLFPNDEVFKDVNKKDYKRSNVSYENKSDRYIFKKKDYAKQFCYIYASRLNQMIEPLKNSIQKKWGNNYPIKKLFELKEDYHDKCIVIGTLFKHQELKPSILKDISEENQLAPQPPRYHFANENDVLVLEDALQRIRLAGKVDIQGLVTGVVCAVLGYNSFEDGDGRFVVEDLLFYGGGPQKPLKVLKESPLLVIISGLNQTASTDLSMPMELFQHWVFGNVEGFDDQDLEASNIVRIIVAGNSTKENKLTRAQLHNHKALEKMGIFNAIKSVDNFTQSLAQSVAVDLMPGEFDPANHMLPQQPMHMCMFPKSTQYKTFKSVTNPYVCEIAGRMVMGSSGQNVQDIDRYSSISDNLEALRNTLIWSHIFPTAPDTTPCYPYFEQDPFVITECPHVYFAGNAKEFQTELYEGSNGNKTRLVCVPSFQATQSVAVINLRTLECEKMSFSAGGI